MKREAIRRQLEVKRLVAERLWTFPNVTGVGVGWRVRDGVRTEEVCIRVYVAKKLPRSALDSSGLVPSEIDGVSTDVIEANFVSRAGTRDPDLRGGENAHNPIVSHLFKTGSGTFGMVVFDRRLGIDLMLSNWHVLAGRDGASPGEEIWHFYRNADGSWVQNADGSWAQGLVGRLERWVIDQHVDAAVARLTGHRFLLRAIREIGAVSGVTAPELGMGVRKYGKGTGLTAGRVDDISFDLDVQHKDGVNRHIEDQVAVAGDGILAEGGDSGSVWVDDQNRAIALHHAGDDRGKVEIGSPMDAVLAALDVTISHGISMHEFVAISAQLLH